MFRLCRLTLLAETSLRVRLGDTLSQVFHPNIGSPQGCSASPIFFIILLNKAMSDLKKRLPEERPSADLGLPEHADDADDADFLSTEKTYLKQTVLPCVEQVFGEYNLNVIS